MFKNHFWCWGVLFTVLSGTVESQSYFITTYPTVYDKDAREVLVTSDGGYLIAGSTNNSNPADADLYVMKADANGTFMWGKTYGGSKPEYAFSAVATSDGNFLVVGYSQSFGGGDYDVYVVKIDPSGNLLWQKNYGGTGNEHGKEIIPTSDGNYVIVGSGSSGQTSQQAFLMKIDPSGNALWTKYYGGSNIDGGNSVKQLSDGGYIICGQTFSFGNNSGVVYLVRTNSTGDTLWTKVHNTGSLLSEATSLVVNSDGSSVFVVRDSTAANDIDVRVMKADASGSIVWNKDYGGAEKDTPKRIRNTTDGGYVISSSSRSFGWINPDMWILKLTPGGDLTWGAHFGGADHEHGNDVKQTSDGGYVVTGHSKSYGTDGQRIMLVRMNDAGAVGIKANDQLWTFELFPNPAVNGSVNLKCPRTTAGRVKVSNAAGGIVYDSPASFEAGTTVVDVGTLTPGAYFISILTDRGAMTGKLLIQ